MTMGLLVSILNGFTYKRKQRAADNVIVGRSIMRQLKET